MKILKKTAWFGVTETAIQSCFTEMDVWQKSFSSFSRNTVKIIEKYI